MCNVWHLQDSSNSGANVKRLDQESKDQMKEIERSIAAKKKEVGDTVVQNPLLSYFSASIHALPSLHTYAGDGQAAGLCY